MIPPELTIQTLASIASKPGYWVRMLRNDPIEFANFSGRGFTIHSTGELFNPAASWDNIVMLRDRWPGKLILKGPISPSDARRAVSLGVDGLQLSNHGGRQLDRAVAPVNLVAPVREAVGPEVALVVDSGVRHGSDIAVALALGADACSIGRAYLYGLMAGGEPGIDKAIDILTEQFNRTLHLLGMLPGGRAARVWPRAAGLAMISGGQLLGFTLASLVMIVIPGPGVLSWSAGRWRTGAAPRWPPRAATLPGNYVVAAFVAVGLGSILQRSATAFVVVKVIGAAYLVWLGVQAIRHRKSLAEAFAAVAEPREGWRAARDGGWWGSPTLSRTSCSAPCCRSS